MKRSGLILPLFLALAAALPASAQSGRVTVTVDNMKNGEGIVLANLCGDPAGSFPGACMTHSALAKAEQGTVTLAFDNVLPGRYALQAFHDEDGNMVPNIPGEGYAFGNDATWPPSFDNASFSVSGDTSHTVRMQYIPASPPPTKAARAAAAPEGVVRSEVREDGLNGLLYRPAGDHRVPALIVLGGSEGGLQAASGIGAGFARHGYAVLTLAYFMEGDLPKSLENIPLEYFDKALDWLKKQPGIDPNAIGVMGGSRGSEAALLLASRRQDIRAAAAFSPSGIVWQGLNFQNPMNMGPAWTLDGKPLPFLIPDGMAYRPGAAMTPMFANVLGEARTRPDINIPVEKINGPILLISGKSDALWPSHEMSEKIVARAKASNFGHTVQHLAYEAAGHMVFMGDPTSGAAQSMARAPVNPMLGGTGEANMAAWQDNWPKTLAFFDAALKE
jgi:dienelactone hydrolase/uncharacterized protein (DUF2141 family)